MLRILHISDFHLVSGSATLSGVFGFLSSQGFPILAQYYSFADQIIQAALPIELARIASGVPSIVALTGDIAAWPGDAPPLIDAHYHPYVQSLAAALPPSSKILPILGNHDWEIPFTTVSTPFLQTNFQTDYEIADSRVKVFGANNLHVVFFLIDSNKGILPATGEVTHNTQSFLGQTFADGRKGQLGISGSEYDAAIKLLLLHHSPLPYHEYGGSLSRRDARSLELTNALPLLNLCKDDVDILLFGHTHVATVKSFEGFITIDAGTTLARLGPNQTTCTLHVIDLLGRDTVQVESFHWIRGAFGSQGYSPITFRRGSVTTPVLGHGRWG
jgi:3',5'-cyclic AMP phosphodiesterase CpdA